MTDQMTYAVVDKHTGLTMRRFNDRRRASRYADKLDLQYGAIRYIVKLL